VYIVLLLYSYKHASGTNAGTLIIHVLELCMVWSYFILYSVLTPACGYTDLWSTLYYW